MVWVIVGRLGWLFLIVICFVLMLCDIYTIVEKGRVNLVDKTNVERSIFDSFHFLNGRMIVVLQKTP